METLDSVPPPAQEGTSDANGDSSHSPSGEANALETQHDAGNRTLFLLRRLAFVLFIAIAGCETPGVAFPVVGEALLSKRTLDVGQIFKTATVGSAIVGGTTGMAWFALLQGLKRREGETEFDADRRRGKVWITLACIQPTVVAAAAFAIGTALVGAPRPGGTSVRDAMVIYVAGSGVFAIIITVGGLCLSLCDL